MPRYRWTTAPLLGVALFFDLSTFAAAGRERLLVKEAGVRFTIFTYDDGRSQPYTFKFKDNDITSNYRFDANGDVTKITVGGAKYKVSGNGVTGRRLSAGNTKQSLAPPAAWTLEEDAQEELEPPFDEGLLSFEHRRLYACSECEDTWDVMCGQGLRAVCELVGYGSPFDADAEASIATMCDTFGDACSSLTAEAACESQCEGDSAPDGACDPNPCNGGTCTVDPAGGYMCSACPSNFGGMHCQLDTSGLDPFYIELDYVGTWTNADKNIVRAQADRWEKVITHVPCGGTRDYPAGRLLISAAQTNIDGVGNTLGSAGPDYNWNECPGVSLTGSMEFDIADLGLLSRLDLEFLYLHEMGHVIGIGTNWEECNTCDDDRDPEWTCPAAKKVYNDFLGISPPSTADIVELRFGGGTRCGHWSEDTFVDEVMTGLSQGGDPEPLSKLTLASLEDIGYIIDPGTADPYTLPSQRDASIRVEPAEPQERPDVDVMKTKYYMDSDGEIVGEKQVNASVRY